MRGSKPQDTCRKGHSRATENIRIQMRVRDGKETQERVCLPCESSRNKSQKPRTRDQWLRMKYGISQAQYDEVFVSQGGVCALCKEPEVIQDAPLRVDHDHETGRIRGLLCHHCNVALGHFKDDPERLMAAIDYLAKAT